MLLNFRFENFRSYRHQSELSLVAGRTAEAAAVRKIDWNRNGGTVSALPAAVLYGANASGKSNVLKAMALMRHIVLRSFQAGTATTRIPAEPFKLDAQASATPTTFEVDLVLDGVRHLYGFEYDGHAVRSEWWHWWPNGRRAMILDRDGEQLDLGSVDRTRGRVAAEVLRSNALYLSTAAATKHSLAEKLHGWFQRNLLLAEEESRRVRQTLTIQLLQDESSRPLVKELMRAADLGIVDAQIESADPELIEKLQAVVTAMAGEVDSDADMVVAAEAFDSLRLHHRVDADTVVFDMHEESLGTLVWIGLLGPVVAALRDGSVLLADELDGSLHPALVRQLIALFQDPATNPRRAQLIANSHDISLLDLNEDGSRLLGRDQCWFADKSPDGSSRLYPLTDFDPRKEEAVGRRYLKGHYGSVPIVSHGEFAQALTSASIAAGR